VKGQAVTFKSYRLWIVVNASFVKGFVVSDGPDNLVLVYLRRMDEKLDRLASSVSEVGRRVTSLETKVALLQGDVAAQSERIDRIEVRLDRIEGRLDVAHA